MERLFNPFRFIAGTKALILGIIFIISTSLLLYSVGMIQDTYIHFGYYKASFRQILLVQIAWWIVPAILYYTGGLFLSSSRFRIIDVLGTTAFTQLLFIPMIAFLLIPSVRDATMLTLGDIQQGVEVNMIDMLIIPIYGILSFLSLALFYIWNYFAFSVSCNVSASKAIIYYIVIQILMILSGLFI